MSASNEHEDDGEPTIKNVIGHLKQNIVDSAKAHELRTKEITAILKKCESGELSVEAALALNDKYHERWGEALPGSRAYSGTSDERIIQDIDDTRKGVHKGGWAERVFSSFPFSSEPNKKDR